MQLKDKNFEPFLDSSTILARVAELAQRMNTDYQGKTPVVIVVLNGAFAFASDLVRLFSFEMEICFVKFVSYEGLTSSGMVDEVIGLDKNLRGRDVLVIEDIVDTGLTMSEIVRVLKEHHPASFAIATLLYKPACVKKQVALKYIGFEIDPQFVVGYGLDYDGLGRNWPGIYKVIGDG